MTVRGVLYPVVIDRLDRDPGLCELGIRQTDELAVGILLVLDLAFMGQLIKGVARFLGHVLAAVFIDQRLLRCAQFVPLSLVEDDGERERAHGGFVVKFHHVARPTQLCIRSSSTPRSMA